MLRVLVVDDELGMRVGAARVLERLRLHLPELDQHETSFVATQAESGEQALNIMAQSSPDILLLDYKLPGISGLDVLAEISSRSYDVLTIMITAYATLDTAIVATQRGAFDFLAKPFTPDELRTTVLKAAKHVVLNRHARQHADEKRRLRFEFISVLAHELKAPLAAVEGYIMAMQDRSLGDELPSYLPMLDASLVRLHGMRKLVTDLLDMTRLESGQRKRELEKLDIVEVAKAAIETVSSEAQSRLVSITLQSQTPVYITADRYEIELVLLNLLTNAIKYNRKNGKVEIFVETKNQKIIIKITDTGIGMNTEEVARIFKEFVRIRNNKTRLIPGSGLGLATVRKVAMLYGGNATVKSEPDKGTTVEVILNSK
ncbi:MAG: response regulator [Deltaproteobacteria bacterium]|nr:response regulator [Deltaproteobacteria bacterium]